MIRTLAILTLIITSGCVSDKSQHFRFNDIGEFREHPLRAIRQPDGTYSYPSNHWQFDRDLLNRLNDRDELLEQQ